MWIGRLVGLDFLQDDFDFATREFILREQPDRNDADAEPAEDPFAHPLGIVGEILPLHRDYDLAIGTGEMPFVAGREPGVDDAVMYREIGRMERLSPALEYTLERRR